MIRKPKYHPTYGISLVGINFRERWNVVEYATKEELEKYIDLFRFNKQQKREYGGKYHEWRAKVVPAQAQMRYLRKLWRIRHSDTFDQGIMYRMDRYISRWNLKLGIPQCEGSVSPYAVDRDRDYSLKQGDLVVLTHKDELGTLYFSKIDAVDSKYTYAFRKDSAQLASLIPLEDN